MSIVSGEAAEVKRATLNVTTGTGIEEDIARLTAAEDREIVAFHVTADNTLTTVELSFSSAAEFPAPPSGTFDANDSRSPVIAARFNTTILQAGDVGTGAALDTTPIIWKSGEEIHLHTEAGASAAVSVVIYYREQ